MPRKFRSRRRKRFSKRFRKKRAALKSKLNRLSKFVYKTIENKYVDRLNGVNEFISDQEWRFTNLTLMPSASGVGDNQRIANSVTVGNIHLSMMIKDMLPAFHARLIIVQFPTHEAGFVASAVASDILAYSTPAAMGQAPTEAHVLMSPYRRAPTRKYRVLYDKTFTTNVSKSAESDADTRIVRVTLKPKHNVVSWSSGTGQTTPYINNIIALWRMSDGDYNFVTANTFSVQWLCRMSYRDS